MTDDFIRKDEIESVIARLFVSTDSRDWTAVRGCFADKVRFDMTSLAGGEPATLTPDQIADAWKDGLAPIEAIHHQVDRFRIEAATDTAKASCHGVAYHYRRTKSGRNTRAFVGTYDFELRAEAPSRWTITAFKFNLEVLDGNLELEKD